MTSRSWLRLAAMLVASAVLVIPALPAGAAEAEPPVSNTAWYWVTQSSQKVTDPTSGADVATIESPNPFCPSTSLGGPPEQAGTCKEGRLPVEVRGSEYDEPDKISAVAFDLSLVPIGSEVRKMTVRFLEANDEQSAPVNAEGKILRACFIDEFFGGGDARQYSEAPKHSCSDTDPTAEREEVQIKNAEGETVDRFQYVFDLTPFAIRWVEEGKLQSSIMLYPVQPKEADFDPSTDSNWRVVLSGPATDNGVITNIRFTPPADDGLGGLDFGNTGTTEVTSGGFGTTSTGSVGTASPTTVSPSGDAGDAEVTPDDAAGDPAALAAEPTAATEVESLPAYVWLAILAGLIGFSLVRQVVLEGATGIRPDGVLAQIRRVNTDRRGAPIEEVAAAPARFEPLLKSLAGLGGRARDLATKIRLPFRKEG